MMLLKKKIARFTLNLSLCMVAALLPISQVMAAQKSKNFVSDDDRFMALRDAAMHDDAKAVQMHAATLNHYELLSYVDYYVLKTRLVSASVTDVKAFLARYEGSAIADRLRNDWLLILGKRADWINFDIQYPQFVVADDTQLKCYALLSRAIKQQNVAAEARSILLAPRDYADGCYSLVTYLYEKAQLTENDVWDQVRMASENSAMPQAIRLGNLLNIPEKSITQAIEKSSNLLKKPPSEGKIAHGLYLIALGRAAKLDPEEAADNLMRYSGKFSDSERALGWAQIALQAAQKLRPVALEYWQKAEGASLSQEGYQWRVRTALREGDWHLVKSAITSMPAGLKNDPAWVYWYARSLMSEGRSQEAHVLFASIAEQMHFYGQLALEEVGQKIGVPTAINPVTSEELAQTAKNQNLQRALKFYSMNLRFEGTREWNWELRRMSERQHLAAAELARQNNLLDRMVSTSDRTRGEMDFSQRYPTPFNDSMYKTTQALGMDMAWVYGLIRQESRFVMQAKSHVGASGLMQLMPATARFVAKKIGLGKLLPEQINETNTNIALGTNYLNMVLTDLGGSQALASAAYNAGPGRPRAWRASLTRPVEGAIFAETIPFNETRGYVKNVLSNATYYAALFEKKPQSLKARLGVVVPKGMSASDAELP